MNEDPSGKQPEREPEGGTPNRLPVRNFALVMMVLMFVLLIMTVTNSGRTGKEIPFRPKFVEYVEQGKVAKVVVKTQPGNTRLEAELTETDDNGKPIKVFSVTPLTDERDKWLNENVDNLEFAPQNTLLRDFMLGIFPLIILIALVYFLFLRQMRAAGKGAMSFGKSRAKMLTRDKNKITFKDVAGVEEAKEEVEEIIEFLKDPKRFQKLGGRIPKGVLLSGPPGTGKTLLAKAIAGEAEVPFFSISGSDFVEMFVGVGASRVRDMFEQGKRHAPCIIFIDEIDAVGRSRFSGIGGGHDEREQTLNALLVEMDGFDTQEGVIIIAATNRPDVLDNALMRPGRFDRQIVVDLPTLEGREKILKIHIRKIKLEASVDLNVAARGTPGFSGADLANLMNEAALLAARRGAGAVEMVDIEEARDKVRFGRERRGRMMDPKQQLDTAYHEAGHAIVLDVLEHAEPVHKVTVIPRGASMGSTMLLPEKDTYTQNKKALEAMLIGLMGGRAAEEIALDDISTGASNDIERATAIARAMVCRYGMNTEVGMQAFGNNEEHLFLGREVTRSQGHSESTAQKIDAEVEKLLKFSYDESLRILRENREQLDTMAKLLIERETIDGREVHEIVEHNRILDPGERTANEPEVEKADESSSDSGAGPDSGTPVLSEDVVDEPQKSPADDGESDLPPEPSPA